MKNGIKKKEIKTIKGKMGILKERKKEKKKKTPRVSKSPSSLSKSSRKAWAISAKRT